MPPKIGYWILDEQRRTQRVGLHKWAEWFEDITNRIVDFTEINSEVRVSTVFLGIDHRFGGVGPPVLFETMVFRGPGRRGRMGVGDDMWRYASWDDAEAGHKAAVRRERARARQRVRVSP